MPAVLGERRDSGRGGDGRGEGSRRVRHAAAVVFHERPRASLKLDRTMARKI